MAEGSFVSARGQALLAGMMMQWQTYFNDRIEYILYAMRKILYISGWWKLSSINAVFIIDIVYCILPYDELFIGTHDIYVYMCTH